MKSEKASQIALFRGLFMATRMKKENLSSLIEEARLIQSTVFFNVQDAIDFGNSFIIQYK